MRVLLDSNLIIYIYSIDPADAVMPAFLRSHAFACSAISRVETLGFYRLTAVDGDRLTTFFESCRTFAIDDAVVEQATRLRQRQRMSLGDALVAATAILQNLTLATRNVSDFVSVEGLTVIDPY